MKGRVKYGAFARETKTVYEEENKQDETWLEAKVPKSNESMREGAGQCKYEYSIGVNLKGRML